MTQLSPKEKAQELMGVDKFMGDNTLACRCVEEIMKAEEAMYNPFSSYQKSSYYTYNQEVLKELDKI